MGYAVLFFKYCQNYIKPVLIIQAMKAVICRTGEIYLKKGNRNIFEKQMLKNIRKFLKQNNIEHKSATHVGSRILVYECDDESLKDVCGITTVSPATIVKDCLKIEDVKPVLFKVAKKAEIKGKTFKIECHRINKNYPMKSPDVQRELGKMVMDEFDVTPQMKNPDVTISVEIIGNSLFLYTKKIAGVGGLPVGMGGKSVSLLSGGLDSPVSSFLMMKRGCRVVFVHFEGKPYTSSGSDDKVKELAKILNKFQFSSRLYMVPFGEIQKKLSLTIKTSLLVIFYRKLMLLIAEKIKEKEKCNSLCTGENLGQVASQTMGNMVAIQAHCDSMIVQPLVTNDKEETIAIAKRIGTYETSNLPFDDCCTLFNPKMPETNAKLWIVNDFWELIKKEGFMEMAEEALDKAEVIDIS